MIGKLFDLDEEVPYRHDRIWMREQTSGPPRLRIGGGDDSVGLLLALAEALPEPLYVLAVLRVPRATGAEGRYESEALTRFGLERFFEEFRALFAEDARVQGWIGATDDSGLLVLDEHDLLYAYGPLDDYAAILDRHGFGQGLPAAPDPHAHHYNAELDDLEIALVEPARWRRVLPLHDDDG